MAVCGHRKTMQLTSMTRTIGRGMPDVAFANGEEGVVGRTSRQYVNHLTVS